MTFDFIDNFEKEVAQFLYNFNNKAWLLKKNYDEGIKHITSEKDRKQEHILISIIDLKDYLESQIGTEDKKDIFDYLARNFKREKLIGKYKKYCERSKKIENHDESKESIWLQKDEKPELKLRPKELDQKDCLEAQFIAEDEKDVFGHYARITQREKLNKKYEKYKNDLMDIRKADPLLIDDVDKQLKKIWQINILLHDNMPEKDYQKWEKQKLLKGIDISLLPHIEDAVNDYTIDSLLRIAKTWAQKNNHDDEIRDAYAIELLMKKGGLTKFDAVNKLQLKWNTLLGRTTKGSKETKAKELKRDHRHLFPDSPPPF